MEPEIKTKPTPVYETTTKEGTHIVISEDLSKKNVIGTGMDIAKGKLPENSDIVENLDKAKEVLADERKHNPMLNIHGQKITKDAEELVESTKKWVLEKNEDDALQKAFMEGWKSASLTKELVENTTAAKGAPSTPAVRKETEEIIQAVRSLVWNVFRSADVRNMVIEGLDLIEYMAQQGKEAVAEGNVPLPGTPATPAATATTPFSSDPFFSSFKVNPAQDPLSSSFGSTSVSAQEKVSPSFSTFAATPSTQTTAGKTDISSTPQAEKIKDEMNQKLFAFLNKLGSKTEYQTLANHLILLSHFLFNWGQETAMMTPIETKHMHECFKNLRKFIKGFTGSQELTSFRFSFWSLWEELQMDEDVKIWGNEFSGLLKKGLKNPALFAEESYQNQFRLDMDRLKFILQSERYKERSNHLLVEGRKMLYNIKNDSTSQEFRDKFKKLVEDVTTNALGKPDVFVMDKSFDQLKFLILPLVKKYLENIPIDRIDVTSKDLDLTLKDIKFSAVDILPDSMNLYADNRFHLEFKTELPSASLNRFTVDMEGIRPQLKNIHFLYKRKVTPKIDDKGVCDILFTGSGIRLTLVWDLVAETEKPTKVVLRRARCRIDHISINLHEAKHNVLDKIMLSFMSSRIKSEVTKSIEYYLHNNIQVLNDQINEYFQSRPLGSIKEQLNVQLQKSMS